jgi:hypothetical protein
MGDLKASLYDVFGYLFPGLFAIVAFRLLVWIVLYPKNILSITPLSNSLIISSIGIIAYIIGHLTHAIGNWISLTKSTRFEPEPDAVVEQSNKSFAASIEKQFDRVRISKNLLDLIDQAIKEKFGEEYTKLNSDEKFSLLDEYRVFCGKENEREIYVYREGFYRGMVIALAFLFIALFFSLFCGDLSVTTGKEIFSMSRSERFFILLLTTITIAGFWRRMVRFTHYRLNRAASLFLVLLKKPH